jgi:hypothetical protein
LIEIDFSDLEQEERMRNYSKRGGTQAAKSAERLAQEHREANSLMVFYTSPSDIPPSPKEPPLPSVIEDAESAEVPFGEPDDQIKVINRISFYGSHLKLTGIENCRLDRHIILLFGTPNQLLRHNRPQRLDS